MDLSVRYVTAELFQELPPTPKLAKLSTVSPVLFGAVDTLERRSVEKKL